LDFDQRNDIKRRIDEASKLSDSSIVNAYSIVVKYSVKNGAEKLLIRQFRDTIDNQINNTLIPLLKDEEWLLDSVGLNTLQNNNLLPTLDQGVKAKDVYEAFLRFDDKPMISGIDAITRSLSKYCMNGEFCIATGDGINFNRYFLQEIVPFFDVTDPTYWLIDKSKKPVIESKSDQEQKIETDTKSNYPPAIETEKGKDYNKKEENEEIRRFKSITVSGKVPLERYTELFNYFITPFAMSGNKLDIEVSFKIHSTPANPLNESNPQYKSAKEAARQLGLDFEEE
jgi:hypothetical protein